MIYRRLTMLHSHCILDPFSDLYFLFDILFLKAYSRSQLSAWKQSSLLPRLSDPPPLPPPGGGGGGHCLFEGICTHCQTTTLAFWCWPALSLCLLPPSFDGYRPPPPKIKHAQWKSIYKSDPKYST